MLGPRGRGPEADANPDYRTLFEAAPDLYLVIAPDAPRHTITAASDAYLRATRTTRGDLLGRGFSEAFSDPRDGSGGSAVADADASLRRVLEKRAPDALPIQRRDVRRTVEAGGGFEERWWRALNSPVLGPSGEVAHILHRVEDVTGLVGSAAEALAEEQRARESVRASDVMFARMLDASSDAIIAVDDAQIITIYNEGARNIFGYARDEVLGRSFDVLVPERHREATRKQIGRAALGGEDSSASGPRGRSVTRVRKSGEEFPAEVAFSTVELGGERVVTMTMRDVSAQTRLEAEQRFLLEAARLLGGTLDHEEMLSQMASLSVGHVADLCFLDVWTDDDWVRRSTCACRAPSDATACATLMGQGDEREPSAIVRAIFQTGSRFAFEDLTPDVVESLARNEGERAAIRAIGAHSFVGVPLHAGGRVVAAMGLFSCRGSRRYDAVDLALAHELADRVSLCLEKARLYRRARRAVTTRDDVLAVVAHDLRSPVGIVRLQADVLRGASASDRRAQDAARVIERAAERMSRIIQDLLDAASLDAGRLSIERAVLDGASVAREAVEAHAPFARAAALQIDVVGSAPDALVLGDRARILQVLDNLVANAIKFTPAGGQITLGVTSAHDHVVFSVIDSGVGVAREDLAHLFERFWQGTRAKKRGVGLGLAIAKGIVEGHGGRIWAESVEGRGSAFCFALPRVPGAPSVPVAAT
jgi:PAS domain S-box-containing protein